MKKGIILLTIILFMLIITGCNNTKNTDAEKFKQEYESLNNKKAKNNKKYRKLSIPKDNPFIYSTAEEIVDKINNHESFIVYFGFKECPWCRSIIEQLISAAKNQEVKTIYYVDIKEIRDEKTIDKDGEIKTTKEGTESYLQLLNLMSEVLDDYTIETKNNKNMNLGEKRIYAPNVISISNGKAIQLETGISDETKNPYDKLTNKMKKYSYNKFKCLMKCLEEESNICKKNSC